MRSELRHEEVREAVSARLDGELDPETERAVIEHLDSCESCREYEQQLSAVKRAVALQPAVAVPDLSDRIITRVSAERSGRLRERRVRFRIAIAAAAITALVLASSSLPNGDRSPGVALASEVARDVRAAAERLSTYRASFSIIERGWHRLVPVRNFAADVWFKAPEDFRLRIRDLTDYPKGAWPTNDVDLVADPHRWSITETTSCPTAALPTCGIQPERARRTVTNRQPFDGTTALPTDIIVPLESVAGADGLRVVGSDNIAGREAYHVVLPYWQAVPLVRSLEAGGSWRPFNSNDQVDLWLDRDSWFPLRFTVTPASGGVAALEVNATSLSEPAIGGGVFRVPHSAGKNGGFRERTHPPASIELGGLPLYRAGRVGTRYVRSYASGMSWLKVTSEPPSRPGLAILSEALEPVDGGVAYYEPSSDMLRRRLDIFGTKTHLVVETNLPKQRLIDVAATQDEEGHAYRKLRVAGGPVERIDTDDVGALEYAKHPTYLPVGYRLDAALLTRSSSTRTLSLYFRRSEAGSDGDEIRVIATPTLHALPPSSEDLDAVRLPDLTARWSPTRGELEWIDDTTYRAVSVPAFDLDTAIRIAQGLTR